MKKKNIYLVAIGIVFFISLRVYLSSLHEDTYLLILKSLLFATIIFLFFFNKQFALLKIYAAIIALELIIYWLFYSYLKEFILSFPEFILGWNVLLFLAIAARNIGILALRPIIIIILLGISIFILFKGYNFIIVKNVAANINSSLETQEVILEPEWKESKYLYVLEGNQVQKLNPGYKFRFEKIKGEMSYTFYAHTINNTVYWDTKEFGRLTESLEILVSDTLFIQGPGQFQVSYKKILGSVKGAHLITIDWLIIALITILLLLFVNNFFDDQKLNSNEDIIVESIHVTFSTISSYGVLYAGGLLVLFLFNFYFYALVVSLMVTWLLINITYPEEYEDLEGLEPIFEAPKVAIKQIKRFNLSKVKKNITYFMDEKEESTNQEHIKEINNSLQTGKENNITITEQKIGFLLEHFDNPLEAKNLYEQYKSKKKTMRASERIANLEDVLQKVTSFVKTTTKYKEAINEQSYSDEISQLKKQIEISRLNVEKAELETNENIIREKGKADIAEHERRKRHFSEPTPETKSKEQVEEDRRKEKQRQWDDIEKYRKSLIDKGTSQEDVSYLIEEYKRHMGYL